MALDKKLVEPNDAIEFTYSNARLKEMENNYIKKQNRADNSLMSTLKTNPDQIGVVVDGGANTTSENSLQKSVGGLWGLQMKTMRKLLRSAREVSSISRPATALSSMCSTIYSRSYYEQN